MMARIALHDKTQIETYLLQDPLLHLYALGDLDPFFWPYTTWYAWEEKGEIQALVLLYSGAETPTLLALTNQLEPMQNLLFQLLPLLPMRFYAHLSLGLEKCLSGTYSLKSHGIHLRMGLTHREKLTQYEGSKQAQFLTTAHLKTITDLYAIAYPENWFDARMLETGQYTGIFDNNQLVSIAGIHVYSPQYKAAALGNITTHPQYRGQKLAQNTTGFLCHSLAKHLRYIGLNVHHENLAAIRCYTQLGFESISEFEEFEISI